MAATGLQSFTQPFDWQEGNVRPLRSDQKPIDSSEAFDAINKKAVDGLVGYHNRNTVDGYFQSHPFDQMYTSHSLGVDEWTLSNNYMRVIFGGEPDPEKDNINMAYNHAILQRAEAPELKEKTLYELNPSSFTEGEEATKDSLLRTFAETRRYYKGQIDSDTERFLKQRAGHELTHTTFYGKDVTDAGQAARFHLLAGQHGHLQFAPSNEGLHSWWNLSSKTYAPDGEGGSVPLDVQNARGVDQRVVPITNELRVAAPAPVGEFNMNDTGSYPGKDVDRFASTRFENNPTFEKLFKDSAQRRWV